VLRSHPTRATHNPRRDSGNPRRALSEKLDKFGSNGGMNVGHALAGEALAQGKLRLNGQLTALADAAEFIINLPATGSDRLESRLHVSDCGQFGRSVRKAGGAQQFRSKQQNGVAGTALGTSHWDMQGGQRFARFLDTIITMLMLALRDKDQRKLRPSRSLSSVQSLRYITPYYQCD
jgi:hypothetical protein